MSNKELLALIGEIDGIRLQTQPSGGVAVILDIRGQQLEVIRGGGEFVDHLITREGIRGLLDPRSGASGLVDAVRYVRVGDEWVRGGE